MAGWRQAVELAMTGEEIETLTALSRSRTEPASRVSRAAMLLGYREKPSFFAVGRRLACIIRRSSAASSGPSPMAHWRPSTTDRDRARSRRSRRKPRPGWCRWRATRPRSTAIRTSCGRRGCWPGMRASTDRRRGMTVSPIWCRAQCADSRSRGNQAAQGALLSGTPRCRVRAQDGGSSVCLSRGPGPEKSRRQGGEVEEVGETVAIVSFDEKPGIQAIATTAPDCRQCRACIRPSRGIMSTNAMARSACRPG